MIVACIGLLISAAAYLGTNGNLIAGGFALFFLIVLIIGAFAITSLVPKKKGPVRLW